MMGTLSTYRLTLAGLAALTVAFPWWLFSNTTSLGLLPSVLLGAAPPILLLIMCLRKARNWSGITALCMIPLSVIGIMEIVATLGALDSGMAIGTIAVATFFTALDAGRRQPN
jgi:hypothetical protein